MISKTQSEEISRIVSGGKVLFDEPMSRHTSFRIGGPADIYIEAPRAEYLAVLLWCKKEGIPFYVIGNGSNLLVGDMGIRGVVLSSSGMNSVHTDTAQKVIVAESGAALPQVSAIAAKQSYTGLEFAAGIPGSIGGAVAMNAGAYGGEIKDVLISAEVSDEDGNIQTLMKDELELGYRHSRILDEKLYVLSAAFQLAEGVADEINGKIADYMSRRREKQPLELPSAGSTFKRPEGYFAGKLIEDAGLRGYRVGDAAVSEKHCGFVVNLGSATASDVKHLIDDVTQKVYEDSGVTLEPEVRMIGEFV